MKNMTSIIGDRLDLRGTFT